MTRTEFSGGFGVIFRGKLGGRVVAIKRVEMEDRPKVSSTIWEYSYELHVVITRRSLLTKRWSGATHVIQTAFPSTAS